MRRRAGRGSRAMWQARAGGGPAAARRCCATATARAGEQGAPRKRRDLGAAGAPPLSSSYPHTGERAPTGTEPLAGRTEDRDGGSVRARFGAKSPPALGEPCDHARQTLVWSREGEAAVRSSVVYLHQPAGLPEELSAGVITHTSARAPRRHRSGAVRTPAHTRPRGSGAGAPASAGRPVPAPRAALWHCAAAAHRPPPPWVARAPLFAVLTRAGTHAWRRGKPAGGQKRGPAGRSAFTPGKRRGWGGGNRGGCGPGGARADPAAPGTLPALHMMRSACGFIKRPSGGRRRRTRSPCGRRGTTSPRGLTTARCSCGGRCAHRRGGARRRRTPRTARGRSGSLPRNRSRSPAARAAWRVAPWARARASAAS